ncbi:unnamed protein product, partial [marine sediment metagenome]
MMIDLIIENIEIPTKQDGILLKGSLYYTNKKNSKAPFIIILPGFLEHRQSGFVKIFASETLLASLSIESVPIISS